MPTFTRTLTKCTCTVANYTTMTLGTAYPITITADNGYIFETKPTLNDSESILDITLSSDKKTYTGTVTLNYNTVKMTATAVMGSTPVKTMHFVIDVTDATTNVDETTVYGDGDTQHITVIANSGYYFATAPTVSYLDKYGTTTKYSMLSDDAEEQKKNFYYDFTFPSSVQLNTINIKGNGQVIPETDKYGIITLYNPTSTELKNIGDVRYMGDVDLGNFISALIKVYVKIPKGNTARVLLGGYNTNVESNVIVKDIIETNCGTVEIVGNYNNVMDYENTTIEMYLPLIGFVELDTKKAMNQTLHLIYKTNVINGDTIALIYNTTDTLLYTFNTTASFEIPYKLNADKVPQGQLQVNSNYLFGFTPFVTVRYNKTLNTSTVIANDERLTKLVNENGFVRCSEVFNTINATTNEKEEIETLLKGGVIV